MPPSRRGQNRKNSEQEPDSDVELEVDFPMSQVSNESDSAQRLVEEFQKEYAAAEEKKRGKVEERFIAMSEKELELVLSDSATEVANGLAAANQIYTAFLLEYATREDNIQKMWAQIHQEERDMTNFVDERRRKDEDALEKNSASHLTALSKIRQSARAFSRVVDGLIVQD